MNWCAEHDPVIAAGYITCTACAERAWPVDAQWITDRLILATFGAADNAAGCRRYHKPRTLLIDLDTENEAILPPPERTRAEIAQRCGTTCTAVTAFGERCRNRPKTDGLCGTHIAQREYRARKQAR